MLTLVLLSQSLWCSGESIRLPGHDSTLRRDHVNLGRLVTGLRASVAAALGCAGSALVTLHRFTHRVLPLHCRQALHEPPSPRPSTLPPAHVSIPVKVKGDDQHKALSGALGPQQTYYILIFMCYLTKALQGPSRRGWRSGWKEGSGEGERAGPWQSEEAPSGFRSLRSRLPVLGSSSTTSANLRRAEMLLPALTSPYSSHYCFLLRCFENMN